MFSMDRYEIYKALATQNILCSIVLIFMSQIVVMH